MGACYNQPMLEHVLSPALRARLLSDQPTLTVDTVEPALDELLVAALAALGNASLVWVVDENEPFAERAEKVRRWLTFLGREQAAVHLYRLPFADPYVNNQIGSDHSENKLRLLGDLARKRQLVVIASLAALSVKIDRDAALAHPGLELGVNSVFSREELIRRLQKLGFGAVDFVANRGDVAWRGNVIDLFPLGQENPLRVELEGNRIVSLRHFDLASQRSIATVPAVEIHPLRFFPRHADDLPFLFPRRQAGMVFLTDLLPGCRLIVSNRKTLEEEWRKLLAHFGRIRETVNRDGRSLPPPPEAVFSFSLSRRRLIDIVPIPVVPATETELQTIPFSLRSMGSAELASVREKAERQGYAVFLFSADQRLSDNLKAMLKRSQARPFAIPISFENPRTRSIFLTSHRFQFQEKPEKGPGLDIEKWIQEIKPNDFVVHKVHGIGRFCGFQPLRFEGVAAEFLKLEYQNREFLYVPVTELDGLTRFNTFNMAAPRLDRLGGKSWGRKTFQARQGIVHFARELLDLYALRKAVKGTAYGRDEELETRLERDFAWIETEDQKRAIRDVLADLEAGSPMDRLICGDVSFGKTEVALRAALRVASNGRQVALLCPTTILAHQHYQTFCSRLQGFPISVSLLSRMVPPGERRASLRRLADGRMDIVIGTHALLGGHVAFKNLGLFIIDDEQRFGVFQKEKLKRGREAIDVLTLSATPIPRTLSFSLAGLQDISLIRTPPLGRLAIKNFVGYFSRQVVVSAVLNELERDGTVFIVYNNIQRIFNFREKLAGWLPDIPIGVIHAKMKNETIEKNLLDFITKKFRVLISTTIIENGIDIPTVNTLLVVDADRFGLTQLYQLRGRIGRGSHQAFAYFLIDTAKGDISEKARKRLAAIRDFSELGSGFKLAEFDLLLRGAGTLLGQRQHGHIEALGFDYYLELLQQTIASLKGQQPEGAALELKVHFAYSLSRDYIADTADRVEVYRRILNADDVDELVRFQEELRDRFGALPPEMERTFYVGAVKLFAKKNRWRRVDVFADGAEVRAWPSTSAALTIPYDGLPGFIAACRKLTSAASVPPGD